MRPIVMSYHLKIYNELNVINGLFESGLERFHLRKPEMGINDFREFICSIPEKYHHSIIIHSHFQLLEEFNILGYHITSSERKQGIIRAKENYVVSTFCTSFDDVASLGSNFNYTFIGPVFKSISVNQQNSKFSHEHLQDQFKDHNHKSKVVAIGGIKEDTTEISYNYGFHSVAILGAIWALYMETFDVKRAVEKYISIRNTALAMNN